MCGHVVGARARFVVVWIGVITGTLTVKDLTAIELPESAGASQQRSAVLREPYTRGSAPIGGAPAPAAWSAHEKARANKLTHVEPQQAASHLAEQPMAPSAANPQVRAMSASQSPSSSYPNPKNPVVSIPRGVLRGRPGDSAVAGRGVVASTAPEPELAPDISPNVAISGSPLGASAQESVDAGSEPGSAITEIDVMPGTDNPEEVPAGGSGMPLVGGSTPGGSVSEPEFDPDLNPWGPGQAAFPAAPLEGPPNPRMPPGQAQGNRPAGPAAAVQLPPGFNPWSFRRDVVPIDDSGTGAADAAEPTPSVAPVAVASPHADDVWAPDDVSADDDAPDGAHMAATWGPGGAPAAAISPDTSDVALSIKASTHPHAQSVPTLSGDDVPEATRLPFFNPMMVVGKPDDSSDRVHDPSKHNPVDDNPEGQVDDAIKDFLGLMGFNTPDTCPSPGITAPGITLPTEEEVHVPHACDPARGGAASSKPVKMDALQDTRWDAVGPFDLPFYINFNNLLGSFRGAVQQRSGASGAKTSLSDALEEIVGIASNTPTFKRARAARNTSGGSTSDDPLNRALGHAALSSDEGTMFQTVAVTPGTIYTLTVDAAASGAASVGVAFYSPSWTLLSRPYMAVDSASSAPYHMSTVAPPDAQKAIVYASVLPNRQAGTTGAVAMNVTNLAYGPATAGGLAIDFRGVVKTLKTTCLGMNLNFLTDDRNTNSKGPSLLGSIQRMGITALRYPGGEKADGVLWAGYNSGSVPNPMPSRWQYGQNGRYDWPVAERLFFNYNTYSWTVPVMNFDDFLQVSSFAGAEPFCVINYDSANLQTGYSSSWATLKQAALSWVRYAARQSKRVKYWEFSNESYFKTYNGYARAAVYAQDLYNWVTEMKRIDPAASFGAIGPSNRNGIGEVDASNVKWWPTILPPISGIIDFLVCHSYPLSAWSFSTYYSNTQNFQNDVQEIDAAIASYAQPADRTRLRIAVTETAAFDWNVNGYHWQNGKFDLGHALVSVDLVASQLAHYRTDYVFFWNSRWYTSARDEASAQGSVVDLLWADNQLTAGGVAYQTLSFFKGATVLWSSSTQTVRLWGLKPPTGSGWTLTVFIINKAPWSSPQQITIYNYAGNGIGTAYQFGGTTDTDTNPPYVKLASRPTIVNGVLSVQLAPVSVTIIAF